MILPTLISDPNFQKIPITPNLQLAYEYIPGNNPGIIYLGGFHSCMTGSKASSLRNFCTERGQQFLRFDYRGHGLSAGDIGEFSIAEWLEDCLFLLDRLTTGPQILVGSSMGGWLMALMGLSRPQRIIAHIGLAAAPDFTEKLILPSLSAPQKQALQQQGTTVIHSPYSPTPYPISAYFIEQSRRFLILGNGKLSSLQHPLWLFHGLLDQEVPWQLSFDILKQTSNPHSHLTIIKDGDHRLSQPHHVSLWLEAVALLIHKFSSPSR